MAATGYTPISLYYSTTAAAVPTAGNLANGELALNIADMKLYAKNSSGVVTLLASNAATTGVDSLSFGSTGLTPSTSTTGAITVAGTLATTNGGTNLTSFTSGGAMYATSTSALTTGTLPVTAGGTGLTTLTAGYVPFGNGTSAFGNSANLFWDNTNGRLGIGTTSPAIALQVNGDAGGNTFKLLANTTVSASDATIFRPADNTLSFSTNGAERLRIGSAGQFGIGGATYGDSGQVLTSAGAGAAPTWSTPSGVSTGKSIAMAMIFGF